MAINLQKGQRVTLDNSMKLALVGLGWQTNQYDGVYFDLDASAFLIGANGKCLRDEDFIFYGNLKSRNNAVVHQGDEVKGGDGNSDDEQIIIDFTKIPPEVEKIAVCVSIYDAENNHQNFGQVSSAYIRVAKLANEFDTVGEDQLRFDLAEEFSIETALVICEIYRHNGEWKFNAVAQGYQGGLATIVRNYGLQC